MVGAVEISAKAEPKPGCTFHVSQHQRVKGEVKAKKVDTDSGLDKLSA